MTYEREDGLVIEAEDWTPHVLSARERKVKAEIIEVFSREVIYQKETWQ